MRPIFNQSCLLMIFPLLLLTSCAPMVAVGVGAGAGTGAMVAEDRRTSGIFIEDESIELKGSKRLYEQFDNQAHINITSFNRIVLLTGEVPTETMKEEASRLIRSIENVRNVINEITIGEKSSLGSRSNDTFITSKVKSRFLASGKFQINHIKIITEKGVVFLLGVVKRAEADNATEIARSTSGVVKVVKVFEYLD
ncbi:Osmotically-inducible protein OsmY, contains BON domain [Nitrosomonas marina]|uniref:Osmotically-inducible protein OsmY, contains BON domain n=1 Tax=Nitrosomonas marina TaxID=917 RepID=A0A1I0EJ52_9PROT|nr:BON domain-containing protein [Nitrosomonas marina]SET45175.1 Osmotically-inducible protein OsmY, contains BON domain [Nitrosomonas marina]